MTRPGREHPCLSPRVLKITSFLIRDSKRNASNILRSSQYINYEVNIYKNIVMHMHYNKKIELAQIAVWVSSEKKT